jgi:hypothetical protein
MKSCEWNGGKWGGKLLCKLGVRLEHGTAACYFELLPRSGGTGRRAGLKIQWYLVPCGFDPLLRDQLWWPEATLKISPKNLSKNFHNKKPGTYIESV